MKKLLAILLALAMVMSLAACGSAPEDDDDKKKDDKEVVETTEEDTTEEVTEPENKKATSISEVERGTNIETTYTNDSLNVEFSLPSSSWIFYSDDEIAALLDSTGSLGNDPQAYLDRFGLFYDMFCVNTDTRENIQVLVQDVTKFGITIDENMAETYLDGTISGAKSNGGVTNVSDYEDVTLGDETYKRAILEVDGDGISGQQAYYVCAEGDYVVCIAITVFSADISDIEACFG